MSAPDELAAALCQRICDMVGEPRLLIPGEVRALLDASPVFGRLLDQARAEAWDEGHRTLKRLGPDACVCSAWNESECGCGEYGTNIVTPNPYRTGADQ